ncbi:hypothetical protein Rt10032_c02g0870 [Rhodotorula toruloides]|uniref:Uncharacterized protein n=1 Tax=Rhodotorula toruloides TaxID=5286 RepID=A0A511K931_RHOTO|nr:hypothetical protein Rt10032_c02g0870 [Rhodotorula toruloides]
MARLAHNILPAPPSAKHVSKETARRASDISNNDAIPAGMRAEVRDGMHDRHAQAVAAAMQKHDLAAVKGLHDDREMMQEYDRHKPQFETVNHVRIPLQILNQEKHHLQLFKPRLQRFVESILPEVRSNDYEMRALLEQRRIKELGDELHRLDDLEKKDLAHEAMKTQFARLATECDQLLDKLPPAVRSAHETMSLGNERREILQLLTSHDGVEHCECDLHDWIKAEIALQCLRHPASFQGMEHAEPKSYDEVKSVVRKAQRIAEGVASTPGKLHFTLCQSFFTSTERRLSAGELLRDKVSPHPLLEASEVDAASSVQLAPSSVTYIYYKGYYACQIARHIARQQLPVQQLTDKMRTYLEHIALSSNLDPSSATYVYYKADYLNLLSKRSRRYPKRDRVLKYHYKLFLENLRETGNERNRFTLLLQPVFP